jgi:hypothetical protein
MKRREFISTLVTAPTVTAAAAQELASGSAKAAARAASFQFPVASSKFSCQLKQEVTI